MYNYVCVCNLKFVSGCIHIGHVCVQKCGFTQPIFLHLRTLFQRYLGTPRYGGLMKPKI